MATVNEHQDTEAMDDAAALEVDVSWLFAEPPPEASVEADPSSTTRRHDPDSDEDFFRVLMYLMEDKRSRLMKAAEKGAVEEVRTELAAGADVKEIDMQSFGETALHYAAQNGHVELVRYLMGSGAEVDSTNFWGQTPLHAVAMDCANAGERSRAAVVRVLLASSADFNARDMWERTPLHWAAENGDQEVAAALLDAGADRAVRDYELKTPLDIARQENSQQLVEMLKCKAG